MQKAKWGVLSNYRSLLQQVLLGGGQRVDTGGEHRLQGGRDLDVRKRPRQAVAAACAREHTSIDQRSHDLLDEERITAGALHQETFQGGQTRVGAQQGVKKFGEALAGKRIKT